MQDATPSSLSQSDDLDVARANALCVTLDLPVMERGDALPPFFHQIYFWDAQRPTALGRDGHPKVGGLIPDTGLPRRMWAGGRLEFHRPLLLGQPAQKNSRCVSAVPKTGRSGPLCLVTVQHEIHQDGLLSVTEFQDLVYREEVDLTAPETQPPIAPSDEQEVRVMSFSPTLLFRYSALTFNGHRIHYDLPYATEVEGYKGLVVHGPLLAQLLMLMARDHFGDLAAFSFRATAPLMDFERAEFCRKGPSLWVRGPDGRQCMTAQATPRSE